MFIYKLKIWGGWLNWDLPCWYVQGTSWTSVRLTPGHLRSLGGWSGREGGILEAPACCHNTDASPKHISPLWDAERLRFLESLGDEQSIHANLIKERRERSQMSSNPEKSFLGDQNFSSHLLFIYFDWPSSGWGEGSISSNIQQRSTSDVAWILPHFEGGWSVTMTLLTPRHHFWRSSIVSNDANHKTDGATKWMCSFEHWNVRVTGNIRLLSSRTGNRRGWMVANWWQREKLTCKRALMLQPESTGGGGGGCSSSNSIVIFIAFARENAKVECENL